MWVSGLTTREQADLRIDPTRQGSILLRNGLRLNQPRLNSTRYQANNYFSGNLLSPLQIMLTRFFNPVKNDSIDKLDMQPYQNVRHTLTNNVDRVTSNVR